MNVLPTASSAKSKVNIGLSLLITLFTLGLFWRFIQTDVLQLAWIDLKWKWLGVACVIYMANLCLRAWRLYLLFNGNSLSMAPGLRISCGFSVINFLVPARLGEVSLPWMLAKQTGLKISSTVAAAIGIRLIEVVASIVILFFCFALFPDGFQSMLSIFGFSSHSAMLVAIAIWVTIIFMLVILIKRQVADYRINIPVWIASLGVMLLALSLTMAVCMALGVESVFQVAPIIFLASILVRLMPANGLANAGGLHAAWAAPLALFGYDAPEAVLISIWAHLLIASLVVIFGLGGYFLMRART